MFNKTSFTRTIFFLSPITLLSCMPSPLGKGQFEGALPIADAAKTPTGQQLAQALKDQYKSSGLKFTVSGDETAGGFGSLMVDIFDGKGFYSFKDDFSFKKPEISCRLEISNSDEDGQLIMVAAQSVSCTSVKFGKTYTGRSPDEIYLYDQCTYKPPVAKKWKIKLPWDYGLDDEDEEVEVTKEEEDKEPGANRVECRIHKLGKLQVEVTWQKEQPIAETVKFLDTIAAQPAETSNNLKSWQNSSVTALEKASFKSIELNSLENDKDFPAELKYRGNVIHTLVSEIGQGNNVKVYLSAKNSVVKIVKNPANARKQILLFWAQRSLQNSGFNIAKVLSLTDDGMILEQEFLEGQSLEDLALSQGGPDHDVSQIPQNIRDQVVRDWLASKDLIRNNGIWMDLKSANYIVSQNKIYNVDYVPRLNDTKWRYFQKQVETLISNELPGKSESPPKMGFLPLFPKTKTELVDLDQNEFLNLFFFYDIKNREAAERKKREEEELAERAKAFKRKALIGTTPFIPAPRDEKERN